MDHQAVYTVFGICASQDSVLQSYEHTCFATVYGLTANIHLGLQVMLDPDVLPPEFANIPNEDAEAWVTCHKMFTNFDCNDKFEEDKKNIVIHGRLGTVGLSNM